MAEKKKKKPYVSPYERKFGKKHPNNPAERARKEAEKKPKETKSDKPKDTTGYQIAGKVADAIGDFAGSMKDAHKRSFQGLAPSATKVRGGKGSTYNYKPKDMATGDTSPMVRYDSAYEKEKKRLGL